MGRVIIRVPAGFSHPRDEDDEPIDGVHLELLWDIPDEQKTCLQIYQNVSDGTPVSPIFPSETELCNWLIAQGFSIGAGNSFLEQGFAPSFVLSDNGLQDGIEGLIMPPSKT